MTETTNTDIGPAVPLDAALKSFIWQRNDESCRKKLVEAMAALVPPGAPMAIDDIFETIGNSLHPTAKAKLKQWQQDGILKVWIRIPVDDQPTPEESEKGVVSVRFTLTPADLIHSIGETDINALADEYHRMCDEFEQRTCPIKDSDGYPLPTTIEELRACQRYEADLKCGMTERALEAGYSEAAFKQAIVERSKI